MNIETRKRKLDAVPQPEKKRRRSDDGSNNTLNAPDVRPRKLRRASEGGTIEVEVERPHTMMPYDPSRHAFTSDMPDYDSDANSSSDLESTSSDDTTSDSESTSSSESGSAIAGSTTLDAGISAPESSAEAGAHSPSEVSSSSDTEMHLGNPLSNTVPVDEKDYVISLPKRPYQPPSISSPARIINSDLRSKISTFLPQLRAANANLGDDDRIDAVGDDEDHYIEMDLGLGVLKEKRKPMTRTGRGEILITQESSDSSSSSSSSDDDDGDLTENDEGALSRLMGMRRSTETKPKPTIQDLPD